MKSTEQEVMTSSAQLVMVMSSQIMRLDRKVKQYSQDLMCLIYTMLKSAITIKLMKNLAVRLASMVLIRNGWLASDIAK